MSSELKVLIVDDQPDVVESFALNVQHWGHQVETAFSGEEALIVAEGFEPHIVLLDIMMPDMDGYTVAERLRKICYATIVGITALQGEGDRHRSYDSGFHHYFVKPPSMDKLKTLLANAERTICLGEQARESGITALTKKLRSRIKSRETA